MTRGVCHIDKRTGVDCIDVIIHTLHPSMVPRVEITVCLQENDPVVKSGHPFVFNEGIMLARPDLNPLGTMRALHQVTGLLLASMEQHVAHGFPEAKAILTGECRERLQDDR